MNRFSTRQIAMAGLPCLPRTEKGGNSCLLSTYYVPAPVMGLVLGIQ